MENPKIRFKGFTKDWEQRKLGGDIWFDWKCIRRNSYSVLCRTWTFLFGI